MPRKRRHSSEEEDEEAEDVENNVRTKRRAAVEARDRVAAKEGASDEEEEEEDFEEEDDDKDEDYEGEAPDEDEGEEEADDDDDEEEENEAGEKDEGDEEDEEVDEEEPETVLCILADLEEPTEGNVLFYCNAFIFGGILWTKNFFFYLLFFRKPPECLLLSRPWSDRVERRARLNIKLANNFTPIVENYVSWSNIFFCRFVVDFQNSRWFSWCYSQLLLSNEREGTFCSASTRTTARGHFSLI